ncbi:MAG: hypothetical protein AAF846_24880 [Chloroflexota bacterium]
MAVIVTDENMHLEYLEDSATYLERFKTELELDLMRKALPIARKEIDRHQFTRWITDARAISGMSPETAQWILTEWLPSMQDTTWKYWALVVPEALAGRMQMMQFMQAVSNLGIQIRTFTTMEDAQDWVTDIE